MFLSYFVGVIIIFVLLASSVFGSEEITIDSFEYEQESVSKIWQQQGESLPARITEQELAQRGKRLFLSCDFSKKHERCYWDRDIEIDLTKFGRFSFYINAESPRAIRNGTIYFQSGSGWFSGWFPVEKTGWQEISLWKSDFSLEGVPAGWDKIEKIRLSFWKAKNKDTVVFVDELKATADKIMIVLGDLTICQRPENAKTVRDFCNSTAKMIGDLGLKFSVVNDTDVESGALSACKLAIFPYNPVFSEQECKAIERFVKSGGKIMLFYSLPELLAELLGIEDAGWTREEYPGQFSSIKLETYEIEGAPEIIAQGSWNIRIPKPNSPETMIIGRWLNADGKISVLKKSGNNDIPAITFHPNGVFMGHVLLPNDNLNKRQMLLALLGKIIPDMRQTISKLFLRSMGSISGFESFDESSQFIEENLLGVPENRRIESLKHLAMSKQLFAEAKSYSENNQYGKTLEIGRKAMEELHESFFLSFPSKGNEFRALWCHSPFGIPGWSWDKSIKWLKENGFNAIIPNMLRAGVAYYPSKILPVDDEAKEKNDQIAECVAAGKKYGVEVHIWKVNWNMARAPKTFLSQMRREGRLQKDRWGKEVEWLCPSHPDNFKLELESMLEIVRKYKVDGIHFDYIRYPNQNSCYCSECKRRFENAHKVKLKHWPNDVINGKYSETFTKWRCEQITRLVKAVSEQAREINPNIEISAAVFRNYESDLKVVGQDWKKWIDAGYLDFICPMNYTDNNAHFKNMVLNQTDVVNDRIPLYPGIGASAPGLPPEQVAMQVHIARMLGTKGFIIFNYDLSVAKDVLPALRKGINQDD